MLDYRLILTIIKLCSKFGNLGNPGYQSNVTIVSSEYNNFQKLNHCDKNTPQRSTLTFQETNDKSCGNSNRNSATETFQNVRLENPNRVLIGQLNINAITNKFEMVTFVITNKIVVL